MNSGLYALAGASATATAAACANRLLEPITNVSKVYFGFSRAPSPVVLLPLGADWAGGAAETGGPVQDRSNSACWSVGGSSGCCCSPAAARWPAGRRNPGARSLGQNGLESTLVI